MSDLAAAYSKAHAEVPDFEGHPISATAVKVTSLGDGLSEAMKIERRHLPAGTRVVLVVEGIVTKVGFEPAKGYDATESTAPFVRVAQIKAGQAYFAAEGDDHIESKFRQQRLDLEAAERQAAEQQGIPPGDWSTEDATIDGDQDEDGEGGTVHDLPPR